MRGDRLRIGAVASGAGVNVQTLRYYERRGLLQAPARAGLREDFRALLSLRVSF